MTKKNTIIFDLDRTIWDCYCKYGNPIWAKQLIPPFKIESPDKIVDDVGSSCNLQPGFKEAFIRLYASGHNLGFVSRGGILGAKDESQPSVVFLKMFGVYNLFGKHRHMLYKTDDKGVILQQIVNDLGPIVFIDDMEIDIESAQKVKNVEVVNRFSFDDWGQFFI
jgi:predicted phosphatase